MIDEFDIIFSKILLKNNKPNIKKQIFIGILVSIVFISFYMMNAKYTKVALLSFIIITSFASFIQENEIFLVYKDFKVFDIKLESFRFYKAYLIQRLLKDDFIIQILACVLISIFFIITRKEIDFIWFLLTIITYIVLMPINHILGSKYPNMLFPKVIFDTTTVFFLVIGVVLNNKIANILVNEYSTVKSLLVFTIIIMIIFFILFMMSRSNYEKISKINLGNYYKLIKWLKWIDMELYKDYLINFKDFIINTITMIVFYFIMKDCFDINGSFMSIIFFIVPASIFGSKTKKKYNLTIKDNFFYTDKLYYKDRVYIRKKKLLVICSEIIIKLIISLILLAIGRQFKSIKIIIEILAISFICSLLQYNVIIINKRLNSICMYIIKYIVVFLAMLNDLMQLEWAIYWGYIIFVMLLTLGITMRVVLGEEKNNEKNFYMDI